MINDVITKTNGKDKVIDFRNNLVCALPEDYAQIQGVGGKDKAPNSTIKVVICDFTKGTGDKSVTVNANVAPEIIQQIHEVCVARTTMGASVSDSSSINVCTISDDGVESINKSIEKLLQLTKAVSDDEDIDVKNAIIDVGKTLREASKEIKTETISTGAPSAAPGACDYLHSQERVYAQKKDNKGFAPVTKFSIGRVGIRKNGEVSKYPWTVKITSGYARVNERANGAVNYDGNTFECEKEAFIQVSDADMYRMTYEVNRFVDKWECAYAIPLIIEGMKKRDAEREGYRQQNGGRYNG